MIVLDLRDKRPIYEQVVEKLSQLIVCGVLEPDSKLPSVRSLAIDLSVNPNTIQRAYAQLEQDGYLYTITGRGNFVAESSSWKKGRMTVVEKELRQALKEARQTGMSRESVEHIVTEIWEATSTETTGASAEATVASTEATGTSTEAIGAGAKAVGASMEVSGTGAVSQNDSNEGEE